MNPLDAQCNRQRDDAICVSQLKNAKQVDRAVLQDKADVKIFLPFRFYLYRVEELFQPNTYNRFLGIYYALLSHLLALSPHTPAHNVIYIWHPSVYSCTNRRSRHLTDRRDILLVRTGTAHFPIRRNQSGTILQRR